MRRILLLAAVLTFSGCIQTIAIRTVGGILDTGFEAFNEESDLQLAGEALAANLKLVETLVKGDSTNERLLLLASQGYSAYALAFAEDQDPARARMLYLRGREYALRILRDNSAIRAGLEGDLRTFESALRVTSREDVAALFWAAFGWGAAVNLDRSDPAAIAELPRVNALMKRVLELDPAYYYAGAHLYFGSILGSLPVMLGGNPAASREHFETCLRLTGGKFLLAHVYFARSYAVQVQDRELFDSLLTVVETASQDILPAARLPNAVAKRKAALLRESAAELF